MIERSMEPYGGEPGRVVVEGPRLRLAAGPVVMLGLVLNELATNAAKYGALSAPAGVVEVAWELRPGDDGRRSVEIAWRERGGPPVRPPARRGFGTRLLERGLAQEFGGTVRLDFPPAGLECRIALPLTPRVVGTLPG